MASNIQPDSIDGEYPVAGTDNDSQGFRTNFTNTSTNLQSAKDEIEELQSNTLVKAPVGGATEIDNDMLGGVIKAAQLIDTRETVFAHGDALAGVTINHQFGQYQTMTTSQPTEITAFQDFPASTSGRVRVEITITDISHTFTLPASAKYGVQFIDGYLSTGVIGSDPGIITFTETGVFVFEIYSHDDDAFTVNDITRRSAPAAGGILSVVEDPSPQLGGDLDVQLRAITTSEVNGDIVLTPNGVGDILLGTLTIDADQPVTVDEDNFVLAYNHGLGQMILRGPPVIYKSYTGTALKPGTHYVGGYYASDATDANLTMGGTETQAFGTALMSYAAHAFVVAGGPSSINSCVLTVTGISISDDGTRNDSDSEIVVADTFASTTDQYYETTKKWLGEVTYTLSGPAGNDYDFNYGFAKYEDFGNRVFTVMDIEATGACSFDKGPETALDIELLHHSDTAFVYHATAFEPNATPIASLAGDHGTNVQVAIDTNFAWKRSGQGLAVQGQASEGTMVRITTAVDKSMDYINIHLGILLQ